MMTASLLLPIARPVDLTFAKRVLANAKTLGFSHGSEIKLVRRSPLIAALQIPLEGGADLQIALDLLTYLDELFLSRHPEAPELYYAGVRYEREPPGEEDWLPTPILYDLKRGDCEDLACARAAELRRQGVKCRAVGKLTSNTWHITVQYKDGATEDPSRELGMGQEWSG